MDVQLLVVAACALVALAFIGRKLINTLRRKGGCSCESTCKSANRCFCEGTCPENRGLTEIKPKN